VALGSRLLVCAFAVPPFRRFPFRLVIPLALAEEVVVVIARRDAPFGFALLAQAWGLGLGA
jgi:hypothetical protein